MDYDHGTTKRKPSLNCFKCCGDGDQDILDNALEPLTLFNPSGKVEFSGQILRQTIAARTQAYEKLGRVQDFWIEEDVSKLPANAPRWPSLRQRFRVIHRPATDTVILVSDGLSDPFDDLHQDTNVNGYGLEFYIETPVEELGLGIEDIRSSWQYQLLYTVCSMAAGHGGIRHIIDHMDLVSTEAEGVSDTIPQAYRAGHVNLDNRVGALLGLSDDTPLADGSTAQKIPKMLPDMPLTDVRLVNVKLIQLVELQLITELGAEGRKRLSNLFSSNNKLVSSLSRDPVL